MPNETNTMHALEKAYCREFFANCAQPSIKNQSRNSKVRTE